MNVSVLSCPLRRASPAGPSSGSGGFGQQCAFLGLCRLFQTNSRPCDPRIPSQTVQSSPPPPLPWLLLGPVPTGSARCAHLWAAATRESGGVRVGPGGGLTLHQMCGCICQGWEPGCVWWNGAVRLLTFQILGHM